MLILGDFHGERGLGHVAVDFWDRRVRLACRCRRGFASCWGIIDFATAFNGENSFADNIRALKDAGAKVIVDDVTYFDEPFYQDGPVAVAVNDVTAAGVTYFSAAGNDNIRQSGKDISSWEAPAFRNAGSCPSGVPSRANQCMDFDPSSGVDTARNVSIGAGQTMTVELQWAQPWSGVSTDMDLYVRNASGGLITKSENANVASTQKPFEIVQVTNPASFSQTVSLSVNRYTGSGGGNALAIWSARPRMRAASAGFRSLGGCGRIACLPDSRGPSPPNVTSRSGCSASERVA